MIAVNGIRRRSAACDWRAQLAGLPAGAVLMVASRDAGAPIEVPAWCRLTGHRLLEAEPPFFLIQKRKD